MEQKYLDMIVRIDERTKGFKEEVASLRDKVDEHEKQITFWKGMTKGAYGILVIIGAFLGVRH